MALPLMFFSLRLMRRALKLKREGLPIEFADLRAPLAAAPASRRGWRAGRRGQSDEFCQRLTTIVVNSLRPTPETRLFAGLGNLARMLIIGSPTGHPLHTPEGA